MKLLTAFATPFSTFLHTGVGCDDPCVRLFQLGIVFVSMIFTLSDILHTVFFD